MLLPDNSEQFFTEINILIISEVPKRSSTAGNKLMIGIRQCFMWTALSHHFHYNWRTTTKNGDHWSGPKLYILPLAHRMLRLQLPMILQPKLWGTSQPSFVTRAFILFCITTNKKYLPNEGEKKTTLDKHPGHRLLQTYFGKVLHSLVLGFQRAGKRNSRLLIPYALKLRFFLSFSRIPGDPAKEFCPNSPWHDVAASNG